MTAARAAGTRKIYAYQWARFVEFMAAEGHRPLPAREEDVLLFLERLDELMVVLSAGNALAAITAYHLDAGMPSPVSALVRRAASGLARRAAARRLDEGEHRDRLPFEVHFLWEWAEMPTEERLRRRSWQRDLTLAVLGFRAMRRPGELGALKLRDVRFVSRDVLEVTVRKSKTRQVGAPRRVAIDAVGGMLCPVRLVRDWIALRRGQGALEGDPLFLGDKGGTLSTAAISSVVKRMAEWAGAYPEWYSGHSLRIGGATTAALGGLSTAQICAIGDWRSDAFLLYLRSIGAARAAASRKMGLGAPCALYGSFFREPAEGSSSEREADSDGLRHK